MTKTPKGHIMHHTKTKEQDTLELIKRALNYLIEVDDSNGITINDAKWKKATFSQKQAIDAIWHVATAEEKINKIAIKDHSTFTTNKLYKFELNKAKATRAKRMSGNSSTLINQELDELKMKLDFEELMAEKQSLEEENTLLKTIMEQESIKRSLSSNKPLINRPTNNDSISYILKKLLIQTSEEGNIVINLAKSGNPTQLYYESAYNNFKLCNYDELDELGIIVTKDMLLGDAYANS